MANNVSQTAWADHLRGCAELSNEIATILDIRDDAARQAMYATVCIDAKNHGVFLEPHPPHSKTPAPAKAVEMDGGTAAAYVDEKAAARADAQIKDASRQPTPEEAEAGARKALKEGVKRACQLLNQEGYKPELKPATIDAYIKKETQLGKPYANFDNEDLEALIKNLSLKLDAIKAEKKSSEDEAGF